MLLRLLATPVRLKKGRSRKNKLQQTTSFIDCERKAVKQPTAVCFSALSPVPSTPGESPTVAPSPSGCEDLTHVQPPWAWPLLPVYAGDKPTNNK